MKELDVLKFPERSRTYFCKNNRSIKLENITHFGCSESGTHYPEDVHGDKFIVATGWLYIKIEAEEWSL